MEMTTAKTLAVFAIIFGCFAVLYPKIFHPMVLHAVGAGGKSPAQDDLVNKVPPHLRKGAAGAATSRTVPGGDDISRHIRAGPHPGLRAAAEMKKQAAAQQGGGAGKGMMGVVLPMYAVGIVIYLIYTMTKVFGKKEKEKEGDYLNNHFSDIRYDSNKQRFVKNKQKLSDDEQEEEVDSSAGGLFKQTKKQRRDLERLLLKADKNNISEFEMKDLKTRLLETESQMTRILQAMETVQQKVQHEAAERVIKEEVEEGPDSEAEQDEEPVKKPKKKAAAPAKRKKGTPVDSSPDMDSYEFVSGQSSAGSAKESNSVEDIGSIVEEETDEVEQDGEKDGVPEEERADEEKERDDDDEADSDNCVESEDVLLEDKQESDTDDNHPDLRKRTKKTDD